MKKIFSLFLFIILFFTAAQAQKRFSVALKIGYGTGAYEASYAGIGLGKFAFRVDAAYAFMPILDAYASYSRTGFGCGEGNGFCNEAPVQFTTSGFNVGLRLNRGPNANVWMPWLRAGLVYKTLEISQTGADENFHYSDSGIGFEIGTGIAYPVTDHIKIVPAFNYTRYTITDKNGMDNAVVVLSALIGARYEF